MYSSLIIISVQLSVQSKINHLKQIKTKQVDAHASKSGMLVVSNACVFVID